MTPAPGQPATPRRRHRRVVRPGGTPGQAPTQDQRTDRPGVVPIEQTRDDTDLGWGEPEEAPTTSDEAARRERERWERDRPPHWGAR